MGAALDAAPAAPALTARLRMTFHLIEETAPGLFETFLGQCTCQVLRHVLRPEPDSVVWIVGYRPHATVEWVDLPLPLAPGQPAVPLRARLPEFDVQLPHPEFMERLPDMHAWAGMLALQMRRPVPDTLRYESIPAHARNAVLRQNGWMLTFALPHDWAHAKVVAPERASLEAVLAEPALADPGALP